MRAKKTFDSVVNSWKNIDNHSLHEHDSFYFVCRCILMNLAKVAAAYYTIFIVKITPFGRLDELCICKMNFGTKAI